MISKILAVALVGMLYFFNSALCQQGMSQCTFANSSFADALAEAATKRLPLDR